MKGRWQNLAVLGAALLVVGYAAQDGFERERSGRGDSLKNDLEGKAPPPLAGEWFNAKEAPSWDSLKGKVVMLDFWAHWCGPCKAATPHVKQLLSQYGPQGLVVIAVHSDPNREKMIEVGRQLGMNYPILFDGPRAAMKAYAADSFPDYYLVDRKGILRFADLANKEVDRAIQLLIAEKP